MDTVEYKQKYCDNRDVISLFSGTMGLDLGLIKAGLHVVIGQGFDASCVKTMDERLYPAQIFGDGERKGDHVCTVETCTFDGKG